MTYYLHKTPNPSGAYPPPQDFPGADTIPITSAQRDMVIENGGFVTVSENVQPDGSIGYTITPDPDAWEAWKESLPPEPEPVPTLEERVSAVETGKAEQSDVDELHEALNMILTGVTE